MDLPKEVRKGEELNWKRLGEYLKEHLSDLEGNMSVSQFHGGHANLTYLIQFANQELILRRPPFGKIAPGAHDMKREFRVLSKLYLAFPRAPRAFLFCDDDSIIGAPFVILERRHGVVVRYDVPECFRSLPDIEERLTIAMIKALAELHKVDYESIELENLGRPAGFLERQLKGWGARWDASKSDDLPLMDQTLHQLQEKLPSTRQSTIIHNDIKFDNCQFQADNPDVVTSIFDWDMTTLGDPLVDLGSTLSYWPEPKLEQFDLPVMLKGSFPNKKFIKNLYAELTGFNLDEIQWYEAFAYWKGAVIAQQLYSRFLSGETKDIRMKKFGNTAQAFSQIAVSLLNK